jgi:hypothetical protein
MSLIRLWADFNELSDTQIWTSLRRAGFLPEDRPKIGEWVELWDYDGDTCLGRVTSIQHPIVHLEVDLDSWVDGPLVHAEIPMIFGRPSYTHQLQPGHDTEARQAPAA